LFLQAQNSLKWLEPSNVQSRLLHMRLRLLNRTCDMFKICFLDNPRLIVITKSLYTLAVKSTLILAVLYSPHSLLYMSFSCGYRTVCYLELLSLGMMVLSEETDFWFC